MGAPMSIRVSRIYSSVSGTQDTSIRVTRVSASVAGTTNVTSVRLQRIALQLLTNGSITPSAATSVGQAPNTFYIPLGCISNPDSSQEQDIVSIGWTIVNGNPQCFDESDLFLFTKRDFVKEVELKVSQGLLVVTDGVGNPVQSEDIQEFFREQEILANEIVSVTNEQFNTADPELSVITKIVAGNNISVQGTGADSGTGEVTINTGSSALPSNIVGIGKTIDPTVVIS